MLGCWDLSKCHQVTAKQMMPGSHSDFLYTKKSSLFFFFPFSFHFSLLPECLRAGKLIKSVTGSLKGNSKPKTYDEICKIINTQYGEITIYHVITRLCGIDRKRTNVESLYLGCQSMISRICSVGLHVKRQ